MLDGVCVVLWIEGGDGCEVEVVDVVCVCDGGVVDLVEG